ncbi:MAG: ABC transporter substrate-binding protein [Acidimicrobiia bacterium]|nr:ABC transporter substrate-binding protein [Acidimicrobiia bacterium]NNF89631.1 ABC transporter substrate-binding protein [Acidimicrobiia bacterium]NNL12287.1 ABC transporter substrate-binding protein [Acidimicrobiia bacterium]
MRARIVRPTILLVALAMMAAACSNDPAEVLSDRVTTTTTSTPGAGPTTSTLAPPATIATDGVTVTDDTIYVGLLTDLTGPFSGNVLDIVDAQVAFWRELNEAGGIAGRQVELLIADTTYQVDTHRDRYEELRDRVVMFTHSTGAPHTVGIAADLTADDRLAIPATWYSGWSDPALGANVLETGSNYCLEAMNAISYVAGDHEATTGATPSIAIATNPGDYGQDSAAGARVATDLLGLPIAYDGEGAITGPAAVPAVAASIAGSGADWTWLTTDPITAAQIVGAAVQLGYQGKWSGAMPTFSPRLLDTALGPYLSQNWVLSALFSPLGAEVEGMDEVLAVMADAYPDRFPSDGVVKGFLEFSVARQVLEAAAATGDLTPAGVVAAAAGIGELDFGGIGPVNRYTGDPNGDVSRATALYRPDIGLFESQGGLEATFGSGAVSAFSLIEDFTVSDIAADYDFQGPCYRLAP